MSDHRSFTLVDVVNVKGKAKGKHNLGGRYISRSPAGAARLAANNLP